MKFEMTVKKRQKTEASGDTFYQVWLVSEDKKARISIKHVDVTLFDLFKKGDTVPLEIGTSNQKTLA